MLAKFIDREQNFIYYILANNNQLKIEFNSLVFVTSTIYRCYANVQYNLHWDDTGIQGYRVKAHEVFFYYHFELFATLRAICYFLPLFTKYHRILKSSHLNITENGAYLYHIIECYCKTHASIYISKVEHKFLR